MRATRILSLAAALVFAIALVAALPAIAYAGTFKVTGIASGDYNPGTTATMKGRLWYSSNGGRTWVASAGKKVSLSYGPSTKPVVTKSTVSGVGGYFTLTQAVRDKSFQRDIRIAMSPSNPSGSLALTPKFYVRKFTAGEVPKYVQTTKWDSYGGGIMYSNYRKSMGTSLSTAAPMSMSKGGYFLWCGPASELNAPTSSSAAKPNAVHFQKWLGGTSWGSVKSYTSQAEFPWHGFSDLSTQDINKYYRFRFTYAGSHEMGKNDSSSTGWGYIRFTQ